MTTKEKIILESRKYLNEVGFGASSLYQISQTIGISRGNLTYHFKDKEALLVAQLAELNALYEQALTKSVSIPSWKSLQAASNRFHEIQKEFAFIFFDKSVLYLQPVRELIKLLRDQNIQTQMSMINLSIQIGNMRPELFPGMYHSISRNYWTISYFWLISKKFIQSNEVSVDKLMWSMLLPHFTDQGLTSFKEHFGNEYLNSLGIPFEKYVKELVEF